MTPIDPFKGSEFQDTISGLPEDLTDILRSISDDTSYTLCILIGRERLELNKLKHNHQPKTSYVANFVGNANILHSNQQVIAIRSENILMNEEEECIYSARIVEKSFAGGQLRITFRLEDGQEVVASRYGMDAAVNEGDQIKIGWNKEHAIIVDEEAV